MNKRKKILAAVVTITLILALNIVPAVSSSNSSETVSLDDAVESTISRNSELILFDKKIRIAEEECERAEEDRKKTSHTSLEKAKRDKIYPEEKKQALEDVKWEKNQRLFELARETSEVYINILIQDDLIELQNNKIKRLEKQLQNKKKQIELGNAAQYTITSDEVALKEAQNQLEVYKSQKQNMTMELNYKMGNEVDYKLKLKKQDIPKVQISTTNIEDTISRIKEKNYEIKALSNKYNIKLYECDLVRTEASDADGAMQFKNEEDLVEDAKNELTLLQYDLEDKKVELEYKVRTDYNNLLNLNEEIENKQLDCEKSEINLKAAKARYDVGFITEIDYDKAQEAVDAALIAYKQAQLKYYVAVEAFNDFIK